MTKEQREALREKIVAALGEITAGASKRESVATIGGHTIAYRLVYAGGSQWTGCGRDWETVENGWAWVVDGEHRLTSPRLFGFDGRNVIERQTGYYLQDGYDPQTVPAHDGRAELDPVPARVLIEIGRGLIEAREAARKVAEAQESEAAAILAKI